ncbi:unnamed protein product [Lactuca virosa]|uniref:TIR domain-containing protein n=1 Tax=Lactuca virosa TaxID=75947 RepID=A0AAU9MUR2_9ASTR|nr:unnamed protein product [Lactuca virosa]
MASSSSSASCSAPAFSSQPWKYDVFLSFRGEDTRKSFVDHLYSALEQKGVYTYKDDEILPRGESIGSSLMEAIEESQIAVIIFSENYADSSWCLDELACIMNCRDAKGQIVMPIFYDIDPSEVRNQRLTYGEALAKHEWVNKNKVGSWGEPVGDDLWGWLSAPSEQNQKNQEAFANHELENKIQVESWRKALVDASNISGWVVKHIANGHESKVIKEIVANISHRLQPPTLCENEKLTGLKARVEDLKSKVQIGSGGVRMIGIWGVGGGGKTTLASSLYNEIFSKFDGCCFLGNIRETTSKYGLEKLQEKVVSNVLKQKEVEINSVEEGRRLMNYRFRCKNVLLVLDDVDHLDHLHALAGSHNWFGEGSRIMITTRDKHLLNVYEVDVIHNISLLHDNEAGELFLKHAPRVYKRIVEFELLSKYVVSYAGGLPLALKVLGSFLCDKDINEWMSAITRLKEIPDTDIVEKLKISFDGLKPLEKELFLDIACFFRGREKDEAMEILDACGFHPVIGVKVLIQKALITISEDGEFDMHDLVQEMGHYIVRGKHPNNPEKHSRVWKKEDILKICAVDATKELDMIEAIRFDYDSDYPSQHVPPIVANMKNLRWIDWKRDLASPLPTNFPPREICCLILCCISLTQLWEGYKMLPNLRSMELSGLEKLIMTPDFDGLPNLERFTLIWTSYLEEIHPSLGHLEKLVFLSIENCFSLKMCPPITQLKNLKTLEFGGCPKLFKLSEIQQCMDNLQHLHLDNSGKEGASYRRSYTNCSVTSRTCGCRNHGGDIKVKKPEDNLIDVEQCCLEETCFRRNNMNHIGLQFFHTGLRNLNLSYCNLGDEDIGSNVWELPNLQYLSLAANNFSRLDFNFLRLPQLKKLFIPYCEDLIELLELRQLPRLKWLNVSDCKSLVELSELPSSIAVVNADGCTSLESFGDISNCKWLSKVTLRGENKLCGDIILGSMFKGNAVGDHFINLTLQHQIPKAFLGRLFRRKTFRLHLPDDWYNQFCGFLMCIVTDISYPYIDIIIKQELDEDSRFELWRDQSNEAAVEPEREGTLTFIGYVSFGLLRHTTLWNSSYNMISLSLNIMSWQSYAAKSYVGVVLARSLRITKGHQMQTTDRSEFFDKERKHGNTFTIQQDSQSSINILWKPFNNKF